MNEQEHYHKLDMHYKLMKGTQLFRIMQQL